MYRLTQTTPTLAQLAPKLAQLALKVTQLIVLPAQPEFALMPFAFKPTLLVSWVYQKAKELARIALSNT